MSFFEMVLIGIGLSMDAFAVAVVSSITLGKATGRELFRLSFHFGLFQAIMPIVGFLAGQSLSHWIRAWDHWVAFGILMCIGAKSIYEALSQHTSDEEEPCNPTRGLKMVSLSVATSIDAMAVGLSFAMLRVEIALPVIVIGCITATLTFIGMKLGGRLGMRFGSRMEILGGLVLIGIGIKILLSDPY